jgi:hypothetical protein
MTMTRQWSRRLSAPLLLSIAAVVLSVWAPGAAAKTPSCLVINSATNTSYTTLQDGVNGARAGATLWVRGTCTGITELSKNVTLTGQRPRGFTAPTLDGRGQGSVVTVDSGVTVSINKLTITGGSGTDIEGGGTYGGGIATLEGLVTLNGTRITGNIAGQGAGIFQAGGSVVVNDSSISGNTGSGGSGGMLTINGSVTLNRSSTIAHNTAGPYGGGGIVLNGGTVTLNDTSSIEANTTSGSGGGVYNFAGGTVTLNNSSSITANTAGPDGGGGIYNGPEAGPVTLNDSSTISDNSPDNCAPAGSVPGCTG